MGKIIEQPSFTIIGIAGRTNNQNGAASDGLIKQMWNRVMQEQLTNTIPNRADGSIIAAYTDYESDKDGEYTFIIGAKVTSADSIPEGMIAMTVPATSYSVVPSEVGPPWETIPAVWQRIWSMPPSELGGERAYGFDYELYDERSYNPETAQVDVYLSVK